MNTEHPASQLINPLEEAVSDSIRPSWCPARDLCLAVNRPTAAWCFGVQLGADRDGNDDRIFTRACFYEDRRHDAVPDGQAGEPSTIVLDGPGTAQTIAGLAMANSKALELLYREDEEADPGEPTDG